MDIRDNLNNLLDEFSALSDDRQKEEIDSKLKEIIAMLNKLNNNTELLLVPTSLMEEEGLKLTDTFSLLCCLENEIAKLLVSGFNISK